jgi:hypothetical protein
MCWATLIMLAQGQQPGVGTDPSAIELRDNAPIAVEGKMKL